MDFDTVAGVAVGGIPIAVAVSLASSRPYAIVRKEEKDHGRAGRSRTWPAGAFCSSRRPSGKRSLRPCGPAYRSARVDRVVTVVDREASAHGRSQRKDVALRTCAVNGC